MANRTKTDSKNRTWTYGDGEGAWTCGKHIIGCGGKNGRKWMIWNGPQAGYYEFKTLAEAMEYCETERTDDELINAILVRSILND